MVIVAVCRIPDVVRSISPAFYNHATCPAAKTIPGGSLRRALRQMLTVLVICETLIMCRFVFREIDTLERLRHADFIKEVVDFYPPGVEMTFRNGRLRLRRDDDDGGGSVDLSQLNLPAPRWYRDMVRLSLSYATLRYHRDIFAAGRGVNPVPNVRFAELPRTGDLPSRDRSRREQLSRGYLTVLLDLRDGDDDDIAPTRVNFLGVYEDYFESSLNPLRHFMEVFCFHEDSGDGAARALRGLLFGPDWPLDGPLGNIRCSKPMLDAAWATPPPPTSGAQPGRGGVASWFTAEAIEELGVRTATALFCAWSLFLFGFVEMTLVVSTNAVLALLLMHIVTSLHVLCPVPSQQRVMAKLDARTRKRMRPLHANLSYCAAFKLCCYIEALPLMFRAAGLDEWVSVRYFFAGALIWKAYCIMLAVRSIHVNWTRHVPLDLPNDAYNRRVNQILDAFFSGRSTWQLVRSSAELPAQQQRAVLAATRMRRNQAADDAHLPDEQVLLRRLRQSAAQYDEENLNYLVSAYRRCVEQRRQIVALHTRLAEERAELKAKWAQVLTNAKVNAKLCADVAMQEQQRARVLYQAELARVRARTPEQQRVEAFEAAGAAGAAAARNGSGGRDLVGSSMMR